MLIHVPIYANIFTRSYKFYYCIAYLLLSSLTLFLLQTWLCLTSVGSWCHCHTYLHHIPAFQMLIQGVDDPVLMKLVDYVRKTSINSTVYQITSWCVIGQPIRTTMTLKMASSCQQEGIWPDTTILWSVSTSTCWGHSHTDTDKVGIRGKAVSSPETTVPYQLSQHYATVEPVFQQGDQ